MKRADITNLFPEATEEQISALMGINGADINRARQGADDLRSQLQSANSELEGLRRSAEELSAAQGRVTELETELGSIKAAQATAQLRARVAKDTGVPAELLTGDTEDACKEQAQSILAFARYPSVSDGGEAHGGNMTGSTRQQFADWFNSF